MVAVTPTLSVTFHDPPSFQLLCILYFKYSEADNYIILLWRVNDIRITLKLTELLIHYTMLYETKVAYYFSVSGLFAFILTWPTHPSIPKQNIALVSRREEIKIIITSSNVDHHHHHHHY